MPRGIDLYRPLSFREVDLHPVRALFQAAPYLNFMLAQQVIDELLARIIWNARGWVHQAQGRGRYHRLLHRYVRVADSDIKITICAALIAKRIAREPRQSARMTVCEEDSESVGGRVRKTMHTVRREIVITPLFAVGNNRRARGLKPLNRISNGLFVERSEAGILTLAPRDSLDQINRSWDTADWLGGYRDSRRLGHIYRLAQSQ